MKKRTILISMVLACVMLLASCQGLAEALRPAPKTAEDLWERIDEVMQEYDAYALSLELDMVMVVEGYAVDSTATGTIIEDNRGEDYYYYSETNANVTCDELNIKQTARSISAYLDGKAFEFRGDGKYERKLYCRMTEEEYEAYRALDQSTEEQDEELNFQDCTTADFVRNEDKTWTLTYSGYTKKTINRLTSAFSTQDMDVFGADIVDINVTLAADEDYRVTGITMAFEFDTPEGKTPAPAMDVRMELLAMGDEVVRLTDMLEQSKYKKVDDLAICKQIDHMLQDRYDAEKGEFEYEMSQTVKVMGQSQTFKETDWVKYGVEDGAFYYDIDAESEEVTTKATYKNGKQTFTVDGETYDVEQTEQEAKDFVKGMISDLRMGYNSEYITNVTKKSGGVWEIELALSDTSLLEEFYEQLGGTYKSATQTVRVTVKDGKLIQISNYIKASGSVKSGRDTYEVSWALQTETVFQD